MQPTRAERASRFRSDLLEWAESDGREFPWRDEEASVYEVFVAEFFLTQTPGENVAAVYPDFLSRFPSLSELERTNVDDIEAAIEPLGFQRMRAEALSAIAEEYDRLPGETEELVELPRVGPYVANATLCFAESRALPIVDRNVVRIYDRVFGEAFPNPPADRRSFAEDVLPSDGETARTYNLALLDFGAAVCTKRNPDCRACFAADYCHYARTEE